MNAEIDGLMFSHNHKSVNQNFIPLIIYKITLYILSVYQQYDKYKLYPRPYDKLLHA